MFQEITHFALFGHSIHIYGYGLMLVIGFLCASHLAKYLAKRHGIDGELFINAALLALVGGIIGARLSHILENLGEFTRADRSVGGNLWAMINLSSGGLTYYGGFLLATPIVSGYLLWKKIPLRLSIDIIAPCLMVGLGFGRIGCYLNGCCYGAECNLPWAVCFPYHSPAYQDQYASANKPLAVPLQLLQPPSAGVPGRPELLPPDTIAGNAELRALAGQQHARPVHPAQLYSAFTAFLLAGILLAFLTLPHAPGRAFALMLMLEGVTRFLLELVRAEPAVLGRMSLSMVLGLALVPVGAVLWVVLGRISAASREARPLVVAGGR